MSSTPHYDVYKAEACPDGCGRGFVLMEDGMHMVPAYSKPGILCTTYVRCTAKPIEEYAEEKAAEVEALKVRNHEYSLTIGTVAIQRDSLRAEVTRLESIMNVRSDHTKRMEELAHKYREENDRLRQQVGKVMTGELYTELRAEVARLRTALDAALEELRRLRRFSYGPPKEGVIKMAEDALAPAVEQQSEVK